MSTHVNCDDKTLERGMVGMLTLRYHNLREHLLELCKIWVRRQSTVASKSEVPGSPSAGRT